MRAKSIKGNTVQELKQALEESMRDGFVPSLAIVFISIKQDIDGICKILDDANIAIHGATTNGEFTEEGITSEAVAILLLDLDRKYFSIFFDEYPEKDYRTVTQRMANKAQEIFPNPAFLIMGSHMETDAEQLLFGFEDIIGRQVNVYGGMAGDDYQFNNQLVFTNRKSTNRGIVALALDEDKIKIRGRATCGWKAVGTAKTVTRSVGNHVYTVDDEKVLDITAKFGGIKNVDRNSNELVLELATNFPLQLQREEGDPVMRPALLVDWDDHSFICSGSVPQGSKVRFSLPPDFDVIEKVIQNCEELKTKEMQEADALIVFSCAGRLASLGPLMNQEIEGVRKVWDVPMAGMFSNAELARANDGNLEMHNLTTCCVALREK